MKYKLVGLLLLSQGSDAIDIDKANYKQHLCDERIFTPTPSAAETMDRYTKEVLESNIMGDYQNYCTVRNYYEEAVENKRTSSWRAHKPCGANQKDLIEPAKCMETQGILYAQACEKLKQDRDTIPNPWNEFVKKRIACNNM